MTTSMGGADFDIVIATDLRFPGGSSSSTLEEVLIQDANGWRTGLYHLPSKVLQRPRNFHHGLVNSLVSRKSYLANLIEAKIKAKILLFRHPATIHPFGEKLPDISADNVLLVVNHPPFNSTGRIDYLLPYAVKRLRETYGVAPAVYPIGPLVRSALEDAYGDSISLHSSDWSNVFDVDRFRHERRPPSAGMLRIGRHSRPGKEKWPDTLDDLLAAYPLRDDVEVHILGGAQTPEMMLGYRPSNWRVHEFGSVAPDRFLRSIDVFVYFHHPRWVEAFGRVIVEAMASGLPVIVPPHFRPLLGDAALYCQPREVSDLLDSLRDGDKYMKYSKLSAEYASACFGRDTHVKRLEGYGLVPGTGPSASISTNRMPEGALNT